MPQNVFQPGSLRQLVRLHATWKLFFRLKNWKKVKSGLCAHLEQEKQMCCRGTVASWEPLVFSLITSSTSGLVWEQFRKYKLQEAIDVHLERPSLTDGGGFCCLLHAPPPHALRALTSYHHLSQLSPVTALKYVGLLYFQSWRSHGDERQRRRHANKNQLRGLNSTFKAATIWMTQNLDRQRGLNCFFFKHIVLHLK